MEGTGVPDVVVDHETEFLASKTKTGDEREIYNENVRPLKRGRKVEALNRALKAHQDSRLWKELPEIRRELIKAIDDYNGDDPLRSCIECIKCVQEAFPGGGETSGLLGLYVPHARAFWNSVCYKNDFRYFKVWLEYEEADSSLPNRSFGTDLTMGGNGTSLLNYDQASDKQMAKRVPLGMYKDKNTDISSRHQFDYGSKSGLGPWKNIGARVERNKENQPIPSKWASYKKPSVEAAGREAVTSSTSIEVYIDEDCEQTGGDLPKSSKPKLRREERDIRMMEELLKKHPLHTFPIKHLPR